MADGPENLHEDAERIARMAAYAAGMLEVAPAMALMREALIKAGTPESAANHMTAVFYAEIARPR